MSIDRSEEEARHIREMTRLLSGRTIATSTLWNVAGVGLPAVAALFVVPGLIDGLGKERFGLLGLIWMMIGYFSLFDFGLGKALTRLIAERLGRNRTDDLPDLIRTALYVVSGLGLTATIVIVIATPWLLRDVLKVAPQYERESIVALCILAVSLPCVILTAATSGILAARQQFRSIGLIRMAMGVVSFVGPWLAIQFWANLAVATALMALSRYISTYFFLRQCQRHEPAMRGGRYRRALLKPLFSFGGWLTVGNVVGPLMSYMDRLLIGAALTLTAVAFYTVPSEMMLRLSMVPVSLGTVLFPALTTAWAMSGERTRELFERGSSAMATVVFPMAALLILFADEGLSLWLDAEFAAHSAPVLRWLALAFFAGSMTHLSYGLVQGIGRPDLMAKTHLVELPVYVLALWWALGHYGILSAAIVAFVRTILNTLLMHGFAALLYPQLSRSIGRTLVLGAALTLLLAGFSFVNNLWLKAALAAMVTIISGIFVLRLLGRMVRSS